MRATRFPGSFNSALWTYWGPHIVLNPFTPFDFAPCHIVATLCLTYRSWLWSLDWRSGVQAHRPLHILIKFKYTAIISLSLVRISCSPPPCQIILSWWWSLQVATALLPHCLVSPKNAKWATWKKKSYWLKAGKVGPDIQAAFGKCPSSRWGNSHTNPHSWPNISHGGCSWCTFFE